MATTNIHSTTDKSPTTNKQLTTGIGSLSITGEPRTSLSHISDSSSAQFRYSESMSSSQRSMSTTVGSRRSTSLDTKNISIRTPRSDQESNASELKIDETKVDDKVEFIYDWGKITQINPCSVKVRSKTYLKNRVKEPANKRLLFPLAHCQCIRVSTFVIYCI